LNLKLFLLAFVALVGISLAGTFGVTSAYAQQQEPPDRGCTFNCDEDDDDDDDKDDDECYGIKCNNPGYEPECEIDCDGGTTEEGCVGEGCVPVAECQIDCAPVPECQIDCGPDGSTGIPGNQAGLVKCDAKLDDLAKVTARQIRGINGRDAVSVVPVCESMNLIKQQQGVESIRSAIADNTRMDKALDQHGLDASAVVGVLVGRNSATLYVHAL
jgi:hypothetical protein